MHDSPLALGINNAGSIVGESSSFPQRGWILRGGVNGVFTDIGLFAATNVGRSVAYAVSESDHVVGTAQFNASDTHAFIWTDPGGVAQLKDLGTLSGLSHSNSIAYNIAIVNSNVQVVGTSYSGVDPAASGARAFVWQDADGDGGGIGDPTEMKNLNDLIPPADQANWTLHQARSINSAGQIVGYGTIGGQTHAFLLTPTNFVSTCAPGVSVTVSPIGYRRRRHQPDVHVHALSSHVECATGEFHGERHRRQQRLFNLACKQRNDSSQPRERNRNRGSDAGFSRGSKRNGRADNRSPCQLHTSALHQSRPAQLPTMTCQSVTVGVSTSPTAEDTGPNLVYTFNRTGPTTNPLIVNFTVGGTAGFNSDYTHQSGATSFTATTGSVTFAAGNSQATVTIDPTTDSAAEANETVALTIAAHASYIIGTPSAATGTITNDDLPAVTVGVSPSPLLKTPGQIWFTPSIAPARRPVL